jgi:hypothetical protein
MISLPAGIPPRSGASRHNWEAEHSSRERRMSLAEQKFESRQTRAAARAFRLEKNAVSSPQRQETAASKVPSEAAKVRISALQHGSFRSETPPTGSSTLQSRSAESCTLPSLLDQK